METTSQIVVNQKSNDFEEEEPLVDKTEALVLHSRRTERQRKKQQKKTKVLPFEARGLLDLPYELILEILALLEPSDIFIISRTNKSLAQFIASEELPIANSIIKCRYSCLSQCFRPPALMKHIGPTYIEALQNKARHDLMAIHRKSFQHVKAPDPDLVCTCITCILRWNSLCLIIDFAHWQDYLDKGEPIPMIPRGTLLAWNQDLLERNAGIAEKALIQPLWYARILQLHLNSTIRSITRHSANKGNKRPRFQMSDEEKASGNDRFLAEVGPPSLDFPFHRDNYYMLEAYLPNRGWDRGERGWKYMQADQHEKDLEFILRWTQRRLAVAAALSS